MARERGFTLMEMMVTVAISLVVGLVATPLASTYMRRYEFTASTERLVGEIHRARMQAVGQNRFVRVRLLDSGSYVREQSTDGISFQAVDDPIELPEGMSAAAGPTGTPSFNRNGIATATTDITLYNEQSQEKTVRTNIVGRVSIL